MNATSPDKLIEAYAQVSAANKRSAGKLTSVLAPLYEQGIDVLLLKGADVLPRLYGVWGIRPMIDVDMLVRGADLPAIDRIVRELGFAPQINGNPAYHSSDQTLALDLITEIWYTGDTEEIWQRAVGRTLQGIPVKGMGADDLLIYLTAYSVLHRGYFQPSFSKDLSLLVSKEPLNWEFIVEEAFRCHLKIPLYHGLSYALQRESILIPMKVMENLAPANVKDNLLLLVLRKLVTDKAVFDMGHFLLFIPLPGRKKWRRLRQAFWPSPVFLKYRYGEKGSSRPIWTRLRRAVHLAVEALLLSVRVSFLLATRRRSNTTSHD